MKTNRVLLGIGLILAGLAWGTYRKGQELAGIFEKMIIGPNSLPKSLSVSGGRLKFNIDILFTNPSRADFSVSGYGVTLKRVMVYLKGEMIGVADVEISELEVPNYNTLVLPNVGIDIPLSTFVQNLSSLANVFATANLADLAFVGVVEVLGVEYEIGREAQ